MVSGRCFGGRTLLLLALLFFILFGLVTALVVFSPPQSLDPSITQAVQAVNFGPLNWLLTAVSWPGYPPYNWVFPALVIGLLVVRQQPAAAAFLTLASLASMASALVKVLVQRGRPTAELVTVIGDPVGYSFPSGHVTQYTLFFGFCFYLAWTWLGSGVLRHGLLAFCTIMIFLVGPSRIWLGAHWTSDVVGGYALGFGLLLLVIWGYRAWLDQKLSDHGTG